MFTNRSYIFLLPALVALFAVACQESAYINGPGQNIFNQDSIVPIVEPEPMPDPEGVDIPEGTLDVVQACDTCAKLAVGDTTKTKCYVKGWIVAIDEGNATAIEKYGNAVFTIATTTDERATKRFIAYQVMGKNGEKINRQEMVQLGDFVVIYGELMNFKGTYETVGRGAAYIYASNNPEFNKVIPDPEPTPDPEGFEIPEGTLNVYEARNICAQLESGQTTGQKYYVKGWVKKLHNKNADAIASHGNAQFYIAATNDPKAEKDFMAFQVYGKDGQKITNSDMVQVGDFVILYGELTNYNGTYETVGKGAAYIYASTNELFNTKEEEKLSPDPEGADIPEGTLNIYEAREICSKLATDAETSEKYYVKGWIKKLHNKNANGIANYGNAQFYMSPVNDGSVSVDFMAYQVYGKNGQKITDPASVAEGDFVVVYGKLTNYNGTYETVGKGAAYIYYSTNPNW